LPVNNLGDAHMADSEIALPSGISGVVRSKASGDGETVRCEDGIAHAPRSPARAFRAAEDVVG
jgi:hypothetical protein